MSLFSAIYSRSCIAGSNCGARIRSATNIVVRQRAFRADLSDEAENMSSIMDPKGNIVWDEKRKRFRTPEGTAYVSYTLRSSESSGKTAQDVLDLEHTFVPDSFRGQGVAKRLCVAAFQHAKEKGLLVQPTCSYISDTFLPRNPEWNDLVVKAGTKSGI